MKKLYEVTNASRLQPASIEALASTLGWTSDEADGVTEYLEGEGLIEFHMGNQAVITHAGVVEVEESLSNPTEPTTHFAPLSIVQVGGNMINSQVQAGVSGSSQSLTVVSREDRIAIQELLVEFRQALTSPQFPEELRSESQAYVSTVEAQLGLDRPNSTILREGFRSLRSIAENLASSGMFLGLVELAKQITL